MQFGIIPPVRMGVTADPDWMTAFTRHADICGFESVVLVEHAVVVSDYQSTYPYAPSGKMPLPDDCSIPDPLELMAFLAGVTDRITLATGVLVIPNHQAVVLAKQIATVDVLSGGRVRMCVGVGWMDEELRATGADPRSRGRRTDETIVAMRALWAGRRPVGRRFRGRIRDLSQRPFLSQAGPARWGTHPHRWAQRGRRPTGGATGRRIPAVGSRRGPARPPSGPGPPGGGGSGPRPGRPRGLAVGLPAHAVRKGRGRGCRPRVPRDWSSPPP